MRVAAASRLADTLIAFARSRRGNYATLTALTMPLLFMFAALAVDTGSLFLERRALQSMADIAAIAAATEITKAYRAAAMALADNGLAPADADDAHLPDAAHQGSSVQMRVETGLYVPDPSVNVGHRFAAGAASPNAVRVSLSMIGERFFAGFIPAPTIAASATAATLPEAAFSIGSRLARLDAGVLNAALGALTGSALSLSLMDYEALASADASLLDVLDALKSEAHLDAATYGDLLRTSIRIGQLVSAMRQVGGLELRPRVALGRLAQALDRSDARLQLDNLLELGAHERMPVGFRNPGLEPVVPALDLLSAAALVSAANGSRQIELGLDARATGLGDVSLALAVGEPAQRSPMFRAGGTGALVRTAQLRLMLRVKIGLSSTGLPPLIELPLYLELAPAEARLTGISCSAGTTGEPSVTIAARPGVASAQIGTVGPAEFERMDAPAQPRPVTFINTPLLTISGAAKMQIASGQFSTLRFDPAEFKRHAMQRVSTAKVAQSLLVSLLNDLRLEVRVAGVLGLNLGSAGPAKAALLDALTQAAPRLDEFLDALLAILGVSIGEADIRVLGASCGRPVLVQ